MIVHPDFLDHWKTLKLITLTQDPAAPQMLLRLWGYCQMQKKSVFEYLPNLQSICRTTLSTETVKNHLVECGFLRIGESGELIVHDWEQCNRVLRNSWNNGQKGGNPSKFSPRATPRDAHRLPRGVKSTEEKKRKGGLAHGLPCNVRSDQPTEGLASPEEEISEEQRKANHQKFAQLAGQISESLRSGNSSSQVENL